MSEPYPRGELTSRSLATPARDFGAAHGSRDNADRVKRLLSQLTLREITSAPEVIDCAYKAIERKIDTVRLRDEFRLLYGVRIDDIGVINSEIAEQANQTQQSLADLFRSNRNSGEIIDRVGTYHVENGVVEYVDELGRQFVAPAATLMIEALERAGYSAKEAYVHCAHNEQPASLERARSFKMGLMLGSQLDILVRLKEMGIQKWNEADQLRSEFAEPSSYASKELNAYLSQVEADLALVSQQPSQDVVEAPAPEVSTEDLPIDDYEDDEVQQPVSMQEQVDNAGHDDDEPAADGVLVPVTIR